MQYTFNMHTAYVYHIVQPYYSRTSTFTIQTIETSISSSDCYIRVFCNCRRLYVVVGYKAAAQYSYQVFF